MENLGYFLCSFLSVWIIIIIIVYLLLTVIRGNVIFNASFMAAVIDDFSIKTSKSPLNLCVMESCELHDVSGC